MRLQCGDLLVRLQCGCNLLVRLQGCNLLLQCVDGGGQMLLHRLHLVHLLQHLALQVRQALHNTTQQYCSAGAKTTQTQHRNTRHNDISLFGQKRKSLIYF
jgi:hypothetical protein